MVESIYFLKPAWCGTHFAGLRPEQGLQPVTRATALRRWFVTQYFRNDRQIVIPVPRVRTRQAESLRTGRILRANRELMVFVWYPAQDGAIGRHPEYIPGKWGELKAPGMFPIPAKRLREIRVNAIENASIAAGVHVVLVMLPGMGRIPADYTTLAKDLASYGYLVVGVTPTGSARPVVFADGRIDKGAELRPSDNAAAQRLDDIRTADASFAFDQPGRDSRFMGHIDTSRAGIFGHSSGGNVAARVLFRDPRFLRAVNPDGAFSGESPLRVDRPLSILYAGRSTGIDLSVCRCATYGSANARHMNFSDAGILPSRFPLPKALLLPGDVDGVAFLRDISDRLRVFFGGM